MLNIFQKAGWINWKKLLRLCKMTPFIFTFGGRGTGKTYGGLELMLNLKNDPDPDMKAENFLPCFFLRRRDVEVQSCFNGDDSPFKALEQDYNLKFYIEKVNGGKYYRVFYATTEEVEDKKGNTSLKEVPDYDMGVLFYVSSLATFANIRGVGFDDVKTILYDEYIKEPHVQRMKREGFALFNLYESICRNRELKGKPPVKLIGMANANDITNDYFKELGIVNDVDKMVKEGKPFKQWIDRGLTVVNVGENSPISQKKKHTALYKLTQGTEFYRMAIENKFNQDDCEVIKPQDLRNYNPVCSSSLGITIYKRRGKEIHDGKNIQMYYIAAHISKRDVRKFGRTKAEKERFVRAYPFLWFAYIDSRVIFENYLCLDLFQEMFDINME